MSALYIACENGHEQIVHALLEHANNRSVQHCQSPSTASKSSSALSLSSLMDASMVFQSVKDLHNRSTPFSIAVQKGHAGIVSKLLNASNRGLLTPKINVNRKIMGKQLPLKVAMNNNHAKLVEVLRAAGARDGKERERDQKQMLTLGITGDVDALAILLQEWMPNGKKANGELQDEEVGTSAMEHEKNNEAMQTASDNEVDYEAVVGEKLLQGVVKSYAQFELE